MRRSVRLPTAEPPACAVGGDVSNGGLRGKQSKRGGAVSNGADGAAEQAPASSTGKHRGYDALDPRPQYARLSNRRLETGMWTWVILKGNQGDEFRK